MFNRALIAFAMLCLWPAGSSAQQPTPKTDSQSVAKEPLFDQDKALQYLDDFGRCVARNRSHGAVAMLAMPFGSDRQRKAAQDLANGQLNCLGDFTGTIQLDFNAASLASGMAEYFISNPDKLADQRQAEPSAFVYQQPSGIEQFGQCVVAQNPSAVETLVKTPVSSDAETAATNALAPQLARCISAGQTLSLDRTALRHLLAVSLYKHIAMPPPPPKDAAVPQQ